ncbi:Hypothetical protein NTJ_04318 [Nesidiocoris tenuis]|uniref:Uncharacterized protein n=1 Tax=Nesidiocoris tenuis TaxID=355587 RepID=A0ABN7AGW5_9HEMI|nr:Hypothetical protein NTJ_04318 [Nesidiocoris tenuis]
MGKNSNPFTGGFFTLVPMKKRGSVCSKGPGARGGSSPLVTSSTGCGERILAPQREDLTWPKARARKIDVIQKADNGPGASSSTLFSPS